MGDLGTGAAVLGEAGKGAEGLADRGRGTGFQAEGKGSDEALLLAVAGVAVFGAQTGAGDVQGQVDVAPEGGLDLQAAVRGKEAFQRRRQEPTISRGSGSVTWAPLWAK